MNDQPKHTHTHAHHNNNLYFYFVMCDASHMQHIPALFNEVLFCVFNFRFINAMFLYFSLDGVQWSMFCDMYLSGAVHFVDTELTEKPLIQSGCGKFHVCAVKFIDCIVLYLAGRDVCDCFFYSSSIRFVLFFVVCVCA